MALDPTDGCAGCGTIDTLHSDDCPAIRRRVDRPDVGALVTIPDGVLAGTVKTLRGGDCRFCGGSSEHNWGCRKVPSTVS